MNNSGNTKKIKYFLESNSFSFNVFFVFFLLDLFPFFFGKY